jgi:hypothetical protein
LSAVEWQFLTIASSRPISLSPVHEKLKWRGSVKMHRTVAFDMTWISPVEHG